MPRGVDFFASEYRQNLPRENEDHDSGARVCVGHSRSKSRHSHPGLRERITRKGLEALQQTKRTDAINKALLEGKESQNRRATVACIILFCRSEYHFLRGMFDGMPPCPMLVSSLENRKQHETGPTRYRDLWDRRWREALEELMLHGVVKLTLSMRHQETTWEGYLANAT